MKGGACLLACQLLLSSCIQLSSCGREIGWLAKPEYFPLDLHRARSLVSARVRTLWTLLHGFIEDFFFWFLGLSQALFFCYLAFSTYQMILLENAPATGKLLSLDRGDIHQLS